LEPSDLIKGEDVGLYRLEHLLGGRLIEARPRERILLLAEDGVFDRLAGAVAFVSFSVWSSSRRLMDSR
jgi:hypothetical protein